MMNGSKTAIQTAATFSGLGSCECGGTLKTEETRNPTLYQITFRIRCTQCGKTSPGRSCSDALPLVHYFPIVNEELQKFRKGV